MVEGTEVLTYELSSAKNFS